MVATAQTMESQRSVRRCASEVFLEDRESPPNLARETHVESFVIVAMIVGAFVVMVVGLVMIVVVSMLVPMLAHSRPMCCPLAAAGTVLTSLLDRPVTSCGKPSVTPTTGESSWHVDCDCRRDVGSRGVGRGGGKLGSLEA